MARTARAAAPALLASVLAAPAAAVCTPAPQWVWDGASRSPAYPETCTTPLVLQVTDDDGNGRIDAADRADVVFVHGSRSSYTAVITAVDGQTGTDHFTSGPPLVMPTALAAGDLDGDGIVEMVAIEASGTAVVAFEHDLTLKWRSDPSPVALYEFDAIGIGDLDQDGSPEVFVGATVFRADGSLAFQGGAGSGLESYWNLINISHALDLVPASPGLELLCGNTAYAPDGSVLWSNPALADGWTAAADMDGDGDGEVVHTTVDEVRLLDHLGTPLGPPFAIPGQLVRQPVLGDIDGDGLAEAVIVQSDVILALEWTGAAFQEKWRLPVRDVTGVTSASTFDFDGDGAAEVLYHDEHEWFLIAGQDGAVLSRFPLVTATTIEVPVVANIDDDCAAEIVVGSCQGGIPDVSPLDLVAYECADAVTPRAMWNQYGYHVTNVNDDGTIPAVAAAPWTRQNSFIGQTGSVSGGIAADAGPDLTACAGTVVALDGSGSLGCAPGSILYRWRGAAGVLCDWSPSPACAVTPAASPETYTLEVACAGSTACSATDTVTVTLVPEPTAAAGADVTACAGEVVGLDGSGSTGSGCPGGLLYEWREGATVVRPFSSDPTWLAPTGTPGTRTYTLVAACASDPACAGIDDVTVTVNTCTLAVRFAALGARWLGAPGAAAEVTWTTAEEDGTLAFRVERAPSPGEPFVAVSAPVSARGGGSAYRVVDAAPGGAGVRYRIVELLESGRGDVSPEIVPVGEVTASSGRSRIAPRHRARED